MNLISSMSSQTGYHPTSFPGSLILTPGASEEKGRGEALGTRLGTTSPTFRDLRNLSTKSQIRACRTPQARDNLSPNERRALKELSRDKLNNIVLKKADKGTTTVVMNREEKINEGQVQLNYRNNYQLWLKPRPKKQVH